MKARTFWKGAVVLVIGIMLFAYGYPESERLRHAFTGTYALLYQIAQVLEVLGIGLIVLGGLVIAYGALSRARQSSD